MITSIQSLIIAIITFLNNILIPFILGLAFLFFIWNIFRFFILKGATEEGREKAKRSAIYGIAAFVIIVSIWGIVNLLVDSIGIGSVPAVVPDYLGA